MGHLAAVWNITSALGGVPFFGRDNFPLGFGRLPAGIVVKLAPFNPDTLQHFVYLERPRDSDEPEGEGFDPERRFSRGDQGAAPDADADGLRHGRHVLRSARRKSEDVRRCDR